MLLYNSPIVPGVLHQVSMNVCLCNNSRSIWYNGDRSSGGNVHNSHDSNYTDIHSSNSMSKDAMDASNLDNNPNTTMNAIRYKREEKWILPKAMLQFELV